MSAIFVPRNPIETAQEFQMMISFSHPEVAQNLANQALDIIGDVTEIYGSRSLIIHTMTGYVLNRELTIDEQIQEEHFDETILRGHFGGLPFVEKLKDPHLQTFMADMFDVKVLESTSACFAASKSKPHVMLPVNSILSVLVAA